MIHGTHKNNKIGGDKHDRNISFAVFRAYVSACFSFCFSNNACYSRLNTNPYLWWYRGWGIGRSSCASESHKNRQSLLIAIATVLVLTFSLTYVSHAVAPWVIAKKALGSFSLHGKKYNFSVMDTLVPAKAVSKMNRTSVAAPRISVSIRQALGIAGTAAGIGYLVYDYTIPHQQYAISEPVFTQGSPAMDPITVNVGGRDVTVSMVHQGVYSSASMCVNRGRVNILAGGHVGTGGFHVVDSTPGWCGPGRSVVIFVNGVNLGTWPGPVNGGLPAIEVVHAGVTVVVSPQLLGRPAIEDWVVANPQHFSEANTRPTLSPSPVGHVLPPEYARDVSVSISPESPAPSPTPAPVQRPLPAPADGQYIDPGTPDLPDFPVNVPVPDKLDIPSLLDRWLSGIPFLSFFSQLGIAGGGSCAIGWSMGALGSGVLDFCAFAGAFSVAGNVVLAFAGISAIMIIFRRD